MTINILSSAALNNYSGIRAQEIRFVVRRLMSNYNQINRVFGHKKVDLSCLFFDLSVNLTMKPTTGRQWSDSEPATTENVFGSDFSVDICDFIPLLRWIEFGGFEKMVKYFIGEVDKYMQYLVDQSRTSNINEADDVAGSGNKTIIQSLLSLQKAELDYYTDGLIKGILMNVFTAGTETTSSAIQWAMSLLLNHPQVMEKVRNEIDLHVTSARFIEDSDLFKLSYLRCVINETLRLFPPIPLLLPRVSSEECTFGGFNIPRGTILLVNAWAVHRDPNTWEEPNKFKAERFNEEMKKEGEGFKFLPFGMGRRSCPGAAQAMRLAGLTIGTMIQCFEWERDGPQLEDLEEGSEFVLLKHKPIEAFYKPRPSMQHLISQL